jgi:hypothetical protein
MVEVSVLLVIDSSTWLIPVQGLQCHTAPYSWKLVFIVDHQLYEMILTACTPKEQHEWRSRFTQQTLLDKHDQSPSALFSVLYLNIKSLGTVFGKPGL